MSSLTVPFLMPRVEEVVPEYALLKDRLSGSSVVEERYTATQVPSSGDTYSVGGTGSKLLTIRVSNQNDYIDTSTLVLNMKVQARDSTGGSSYGTQDLAIDDHILSLVDTINVKVGGQTIEVLNNVGHLVNALVQGSMPASYYKSSGQFEGLYVYDKWMDISGNTANNNPNANNSNHLRARWQAGNSWLTNGRYYSVPLTLLGICRLPTLFAARNFQDLTLELLFKSNVSSACWNIDGLSTTAFTGQINISDVSLTYDCCRMSADYYALMDNELKMPNGSGVAYPIDTYQVQPATIAGGSASNGAGTLTTAPALTRIVVAKGTRFLKSVYGVSKPTFSESSPAWRNNSTGVNGYFNSYQVIINSKRYPQLQIQSSAQAFQELQKAYNQLGSVSSGSVMNWWNYVGQPFERVDRSAAGSAAAPYVSESVMSSRLKQDLVGTATKDGTSLGYFSGDEAMFQVGVNLEQFLTNQPDAGGVNTSTSGYQIAIELGQNAAAQVLQSTAAVPALTGEFASFPFTHYVILHFTRVLTLKAGAVEILD
jgi:hypothetical protein